MIPLSIEAIKARRDWRQGRTLSLVESRLNDEHLARHYAADVTALIGEVERLSYEVMRYQTGQSYEVGHEHGILAGIKHAERRNRP